MSTTEPDSTSFDSKSDLPQDVEPESLEPTDASPALDGEELDPDAPSTPSGTLNRRVPGAVIVFVILFIMGLTLGTFGSRPSGYMVLSPGPATEVVVSGHRSPQDSGSFLMTTVKVDPVDLKGYVWRKITGSQSSLVVGSSSSDSAVAAGYAQMQQAKLLASQVARNYVNPSSSVVTLGAQIVDMTPSSPAQAAGLKVADVITSINGSPVHSDNDVAALATSSGSGATVEVLRDGKDLSFTVPLSEAGKLGVEVVTASGETSAFDFNTGTVGGPSGGLMFTLAAIDSLTDGNLTGSKVIAGTGTINPDATVGEVGGAEFKVLGAAASGASVFFVPSAEASSVMKNAPKNIEVVPVSTLDDAVKFLCSHGGSSSVCR